MIISLALSCAGSFHDAGLSATDMLGIAITGHEQRVLPRLVMYVQTFKTPEQQPVSLLPLIEHGTRVTHIILASMHLHDQPGVIRLNDEPLESHIYDTLWEETRKLQQNGVKIMALLGGAAGGTYGRLSGTDDEVSVSRS